MTVHPGVWQLGSVRKCLSTTRENWIWFWPTFRDQTDPVSTAPGGGIWTLHFSWSGDGGCDQRMVDPGVRSGKAGMVDDRRVALARELAEAGLWEHVPPGVHAAERARIAEGGNPFTSAALDAIIFNADGEDLAEGGVERFLAKLAPALQQHGLPLQVRTVQDPYRACDPERDYVVEINGIRCTVWEEHEWEERLLWEEATLRPLVVVNALLEQAHSSVRMFTLSAGGNDGWALLLDPRVPAAMRASGLLPDSEIPSLAIAEDRPYRSLRFRATAPRPCSPVNCGVAAVPVTGTGEPL